MNSIATIFRESKTARFFIPLGIILIVFGVMMFKIDNNNKNYIETEATISKVDLVSEGYEDADGTYNEAMYNIYVTYTVDGKTYENELGESFERKVGEKIKIVYNPDDPNQISQPASTILNIVFLAGGAASLCAGVLSAVNAVKNTKK